MLHADILFYKAFSFHVFKRYFSLGQIKSTKTFSLHSGKNLEVTNMTDKGGRKCLLFCAAMLVLTGAVIVAGLYGCEYCFINFMIIANLSICLSIALMPPHSFILGGQDRMSHIPCL